MAKREFGQEILKLMHDLTAKEAKDPTGAGDCFDGAFICGLLDGKSIRESAIIATAAAALNTAALGPMEGNINKQTINDLIKKGM